MVNADVAPSRLSETFLVAEATDRTDGSVVLEAVSASARISLVAIDKDPCDSVLRVGLDVWIQLFWNLWPTTDPWATHISISRSPVSSETFTSDP